MGEIVLLENSLSPMGIRKARLTRMGGEIPTSEWLDFVPGEVPLDGVAIHETHDKELDIHTVDISWMARELIRNKANMVVWWWLGGMNVRMGIACAAGIFAERMKEMPNVIWIKNMPKGAQEKLQVETMGQVGPVEIKTAEWVPPGFVVVGL